MITRDASRWLAATACLLAAAASLAGCAISGLDAKSSFACKAPEGVQCESMSGVYANAMQHNLPGQRPKDAAGDAPAPMQPSFTPVPAPAPATGPIKAASLTLAQPIATGMPLRSTPTVLRIWFAPWEDGDGDLHDQAFVYLPIDGGRWLIEHNRRRIQETYRAVRAPVEVSTASASPAGKVPAQPTPPRQADSLPKAAQDALNGLIRQGIGMPQTEVSSD